MSTSRVAGRVLSKGKAIPGVEVSIVELGKKAATDSSGYFVLYQIAPGSYTLSVRGEGYASIERRITVIGGMDMVIGDLELKPIVSVEGYVRLEDRKEPSGVEIFVNETGDRVITDADGRFELKLPEGLYTLMISKDGYLPKAITLDAKAGEGVEIPTISLEPYYGGVFLKPRDIFVGGNPFSGLKLHEFRFYLTNDAIATLRKQNNMYAPRIDVPARVVIDGEVYEGVGIHLRGAWGSFRPFDNKPGFRLDFNKFSKGQRYHGLEELSLHNSVQDPSYVCEYLAYHIWRLAGIPAPEITWAKVYINDTYKGLYYVKEVVNKDFLRRWFYDPDGNLYKGIADPGRQENDFASDPSTWELLTNKSQNDRSDLARVGEIVRKTPASNLMKALEPYIDMENYITNWVLEDLTYHWDGYVQQTFNNNFYAYHDPFTDRFFLIPHGADQLFQDLTKRPAIRATTAVKLMQDPAFVARLRAKREEILRKVWKPDLFCSIAEEAFRMLQREVPNEVSGGVWVLERMKNFIYNRPYIASTWP
jgi:hypothetical protein